MASSNTENRHNAEEESKYADRLSKRLCYILRYGAMKEGLTVHDGGFVDIKEVMGVNMMRHHSEAKVLEEIDTSMSHRNTRRFERKDINGKTLIRACFCRNFEPNPCHEGTQVNTLMQTSINYVLKNLDEYDLDDFPDEYIISRMILQLKRRKKLTARCLKQLLVPVLEHLDLSNDVYVTPAILKRMWTSCPNIRVLSLKDCGYIVTDSVVETIVRKLPRLESLSLAACKHVTDKGLASIVKYGSNLQQLNLSWIKGLSNSALLDLVVNSAKLKHLDIYDLDLNGETRPVVVEAARQRGIKLVLKGLLESDPDVTLDNPSMLLPNFGKTW